uniref:uncharacterized protein LOC118531290 isoform X3 n=1 Tax=Halichoerus grypus TaxID=9711 RepID=UPI0016594A50|nr:uncharacterized protein LOC118531290 isoform X3 [Halichoerus grypus]
MYLPPMSFSYLRRGRPGHPRHGGPHARPRGGQVGHGDTPLAHSGPASSPSESVSNGKPSGTTQSKDEVRRKATCFTLGLLPCSTPNWKRGSSTTPTSTSTLPNRLPRMHGPVGRRTLPHSGMVLTRFEAVWAWLLVASIAVSPRGQKTRQARPEPLRPQRPRGRPWQEHLWPST